MQRKDLPTYVSPQAPGEPVQMRGEYLDRYVPAPAELLPPASRAMAEVHGTFVDRAKGFQIASVPLAAGVGLGSLILGIVGWGVPIFSVAALAWLWGGFLGTWLLAWITHNLVSPDGIALVHTILGWQYLRAEQRERHRRYGGRGRS